MKPLIPYFYAGDTSVFGLASVKTSGLMLVTGAVIGAAVALRKARRDGLRLDVLSTFLPWLFIAMAVGSHLGDLFFYTPTWFVDHPLSAFEIWTGESSVGAMLVAALFGVAYFRRIENDPRYPAHTRLDSWRYADALVYGTTLGWFIGRVGCFAVHDHPGVETRFWLGIYGICPGGAENTACHDLGLYEAVLSLVFFLALTALDRQPRPPGFFIAIMALAYGATRFPLDILRHPLADSRYFGLTPAQYGSMALIGVGVWILATRNARSILKPDAPA